MEDKEKKEHGTDCKCQDCKNGVCKPCGKSCLTGCGGEGCRHRKVARCLVAIVMAIFLFGLGFAAGRFTSFHGGRYHAFMMHGYYDQGYGRGYQMMRPGNWGANGGGQPFPTNGVPQNGTTTNP